MVLPVEIARAMHRVCEARIIPAGISPEHEYVAHMETSGLYAHYVNEAKLDVDGDQVIEAIFAVAGWDFASKWPGHPHPDKVVEYLRGVV